MAAWHRGRSLMAFAMTVAQCGIANALFAVAESFRDMYKHVLKLSGGYTAFTSLPAVIQANEAKANLPLFPLLGWQLTGMTMLYIRRWALEHVCTYF